MQASGKTRSGRAVPGEGIRRLSSAVREWTGTIVGILYASSGARARRFDRAHQEVCHYESPIDRARYAAVLALAQKHAPRPWQNVLEVGCAQGVFTEQLAPLCLRLTACDISPAAVATTRERCSALPDVAVQRADICREDFPQQYDLVFALDLLQATHGKPRLRQVIERLQQAVRPGGWLVVSSSRLPRSAHSPGPGASFPEGADSHLHALARQPGLQLLECASFPTEVGLAAPPHYPERLIAVFSKHSDAPVRSASQRCQLPTGGVTGTRNTPLLRKIASMVKKIPIDLGQYEMRYTTQGKMIAWRLVGEGAGKTALDLGCRDGYWAEKLAAKGYNVVAVDLHPQYSKAAIVNANCALPFRDHSFDLVWCTEVIEHLEDPGLTISEIRRILRPGGKLLLTTPNDGWWVFRLLRRLGISSATVENEEHKQFFTFEEVAALLPGSIGLGYFPYAVYKRTIQRCASLLSPTITAVFCNHQQPGEAPSSDDAGRRLPGKEGRPRRPGDDERGGPAV